MCENYQKRPKYCYKQSDQSQKNPIMVKIIQLEKNPIMVNKNPIMAKKNLIRILKEFNQEIRL